MAVSGEYAGYILIDDVIRRDVPRLMRWLHKHNLEAVMLTGDSEDNAVAVARELRIDYVYADLLPEDKVAQVEEFMESQMEKEKLAFVGMESMMPRCSPERISESPWAVWARMRRWRQRISY